MKEVDDCLICHNPHVGRDRMMLKRDFTEEKHYVNDSETSVDTRRPE